MTSELQCLQFFYHHLPMLSNKTIWVRSCKSMSELGLVCLYSDSIPLLGYSCPYWVCPYLCLLPHVFHKYFKISSLFHQNQQTGSKQLVIYTCIYYFRNILGFWLPITDAVQYHQELKDTSPQLLRRLSP